MSYSPIDNPELYFQTKLYTGNGSTNHAITLDGDENMQPDWSWIKQRSGAEWHILIDSLRGVTKYINSNDTNAERTNSNFIESFDSNGFTLGSANDTNQNSQTYASWNWKAGSSASNNTDGQLTSSVSVNQDAGFSVLTYTGVGDGTSGTARTVGHGLGVTPAVLIIKNRADSTQWNVYHHKNTSAPETEIIYLNLTNATADDNGFWNDTAPTSSVFTVGGDNGVNGNSDSMVCYAFTEKKGYSKFGSYTGNGNADGSFIYTGFKPAFVMSKCTSHAGEDWNINDDKRPGYNVIQNALLPNSSAAEVTASFQAIDTLSNGFKWRGTNDRVNASGKTYIYMAFAESPFVGSNFVPNNAR